MTAADVAAAFERLVAEQSTDSLAAVLSPQVRWMDCQGADAVLMTVRALLLEGLEDADITTRPVDDRLVVEISGTLAGAALSSHHAVFLEDGLVVAIVDAPSSAAASAVAAPTPLTAEVNDGGTAPGARFESAAPILPCCDLTRAMAHYRALGFEVESYDGGAAYAFAKRDGVRCHLQQVNVDPATTTTATYLWVDDADQLHAEWSSAGVSGRFMAPEDTDYGLREGAHIDLDGNLWRFGSPLGA